MQVVNYCMSMTPSSGSGSLIYTSWRVLSNPKQLFSNITWVQFYFYYITGRDLRKWDSGHVLTGGGGGKSVQYGSFLVKIHILNNLMFNLDFGKSV